MITEISLKERWAELKDAKPKLRIRDAAAELGVTEAELLATDCGTTVTRLKPEWSDLYKSLDQLGKVMALTRNEACVLEQTGLYKKSVVRGPMAMTLGFDIDLRSFLTKWGHAFAVDLPKKSKFKHSLQFFGKDGEAIHKVYLGEESDLEKYAEIIHEYKSEDQSASVEVKPFPAEDSTVEDHEVDIEALHSEWDSQQDTHDFMKTLRKFKISRPQAFRLGGPERAHKVSIETAPEQLLNSLADRQIPFMIFCGNKGNIQIFAGKAKKIKKLNDWINILDPEQNLHLKMSLIKEAWVSKHPSKDGPITSVEFYGENDERIVSFFGFRKEGDKELSKWRELAEELQKLSLVVR